MEEQIRVCDIFAYFWAYRENLKSLHVPRTFSDRWVFDVTRRLCLYSDIRSAFKKFTNGQLDLTMTTGDIEYPTLASLIDIGLTPLGALLAVVWLRRDPYTARKAMKNGIR